MECPAKTTVLVTGLRGSELANWAEEIEIMPGAEICTRVVDAESDDQPKLQPFG